MNIELKQSDLNLNKGNSNIPVYESLTSLSSSTTQLNSVKEGNVIVNDSDTFKNRITANGKLRNQGKYNFEKVISPIGNPSELGYYEKTNGDDFLLTQDTEVVSGKQYFTRYIDYISYADIEKIKGNSVVWNQLVDTNTTSVTLISNHKYFMLISGTKAISSGDDTAISVTGGTDMVIDLTLMFGLGNELSTVEAFEDWLNKNIGTRDYYPYNVGKLLTTKLLELKSVGFNLFNKNDIISGKYAFYNSSTGNFELSNSTSINVSNYIKIKPSTQYYLLNTAHDNAFSICFFDANKNFINADGLQISQVIITSPSNAVYAMVNFPVNNIDDVCINISDTSKNDNYEPYWNHTIPFDVTNIYGKLNGIGDYVQVFPNGMRSVVDIHDVIDLYNATADINVGSVDLGILDWKYRDEDEYFYCFISDEKSAYAKLACEKYPFTMYRAEKYISSEPADYYNEIIITDSSYNNATTFKTAMNGVGLFYERETPLHYTDLVYRDNYIDNPISELTLKVHNDGMEEEIVTDLDVDENPTSCMATLQIRYEQEGNKSKPMIGKSFSKIEYLRSDGEAYIDTNIIPDSNTGIYIKAAPNYYNYENSDDMYLVGLRNNTNNTRWSIGKSGIMNSGFNIYWGYGGYGHIDSSVEGYYGDIVEMTLNYYNDGKITTKTSSIKKEESLPNLSFTPSYPIRIFGSSGIDATYTKAAMDVYEVIITQGLNVVMDLIPVKLGTTGYLFDTVGKQLYENNGSGSFTLGPNLA